MATNTSHADGSADVGSSLGRTAFLTFLLLLTPFCPSERLEQPIRARPAADIVPLRELLLVREIVLDERNVGGYRPILIFSAYNRNRVQAPHTLGGSTVVTTLDHAGEKYAGRALRITSEPLVSGRGPPRYVPNTLGLRMPPMATSPEVEL